MDEPPFALVRLALPASIVAKGGSFFTVSTLVLFSSTSIACGFLVNKKSASLSAYGFFWRKERDSNHRDYFFMRNNMLL